MRRRPIRVLTDSGEDYFEANAPKVTPERTDFDSQKLKKRVEELDKRYKKSSKERETDITARKFSSVVDPEKPPDMPLRDWRYAQIEERLKAVDKLKLNRKK